MQAPAFWHRPPGTLARLLTPLGKLYAAGTARRLRRGAQYQAGIPVICVGNINAGGTGKTPTVIALITLLQARGLSPHVISRGHGGRIQAPTRVDPTRHSANDVGDEPLLLAQFAPVWVARDRALGVQAAQAAGAQVAVLDDGHQNASVMKDLNLLTVDAGLGFGNGRVIPAGPLREPLARGLARGDLLISIGPAKAQAEFDQTWGARIDLPRVRAHLAPIETGMPWDQMRVFAFAGIGHPQKFFATLRDLGARVVGTRALSDHQSLPDALMQRIAREAAEVGGQMITTEKDALRMPPAWQGQVMTLPVRLRIEDPAPLHAALDRILPISSPPKPHR